MAKKSDLKLEESVFRFLFASPSYFVGECAGDSFHLTVAFPSWGRRSAFNRFGDDSNFVLSIRTQSRVARTIVNETYDSVGEEVSALLGAYYGKLIQNRGRIQSGPRHMVPATSFPSVRENNRPPYNKAPRKPDGPPLNLAHAKSVIETYLNTLGDEHVGAILRAAEFYRVALENFHSRTEIALTMFCSTLEALLPLRQYTEVELYDEQFRSDMKLIREHCKDHAKGIEGRLKSRIYQIKRKVVAFVGDYVLDSYFEQRETSIEWAVAKDRSDLIARIKSIYDLRSRVLHTGDRSWLTYLEHDHQHSEIGLGVPVINDKELKRLLVNSLTLTGMERVTATVLRSVINEWLKSSQHESMDKQILAARPRRKRKRTKLR